MKAGDLVEVEHLLLLSRFPLSSLKRIHQRFLLRYAPTRHLPSFLLSPLAFSNILQPELPPSLAENLCNRFSIHNTHINALQVFAACAVLCHCDSLSLKISFLFEAFDFEERLELARDEVAMMLHAAAKGLAKVLQFDPAPLTAIEQEVDMIPSQSISCEQLCQWVQHSSICRPCLTILHLIHALPRTLNRIHRSIEELQRRHASSPVNTTLPAFSSTLGGYKAGNRFIEVPMLQIDESGRHSVSMKVNVECTIYCEVCIRVDGSQPVSIVVSIGRERAHVRRVERIPLHCRQGKSEIFILENLGRFDDHCRVLLFSGVSAEDSRRSVIVIEPTTSRSCMVIPDCCTWHPPHPRILKMTSATPSIVTINPSSHIVLHLPDTTALSFLASTLESVPHIASLQRLDLLLPFPLFLGEKAVLLPENATESDKMSNTYLAKETLRAVFDWMRDFAEAGLQLRAVCCVAKDSAVSCSGSITSSSHPDISIQQVLIGDEGSLNYTRKEPMKLTEGPFILTTNMEEVVPWVLLGDTLETPSGDPIGLEAEPSLSPIIHNQASLTLRLVPSVKTLSVQIFRSHEELSCLHQDFLIQPTTPQVTISMQDLVPKQEYVVKISTDFGRAIHRWLFCVPPKQRQEVCIMRHPQGGRSTLRPKRQLSSCVFNWGGLEPPCLSPRNQQTVGYLCPSVSLHDPEKMPVVWAGDLAVLHPSEGSVSTALHRAVEERCSAAIIACDHQLTAAEVDELKPWADLLTITLVFPSPQPYVGWTSEVCENITEVALAESDSPCVPASISLNRPKLHARPDTKTKWPQTAPTFIIADRSVATVQKEFVDETGNSCSPSAANRWRTEEELAALTISCHSATSDIEQLEALHKSLEDSHSLCAVETRKLQQRGTKAQRKLWEEQTRLLARWREERKQLTSAKETCDTMPTLLKEYHQVTAQARAGVRASEALRLVREAAVECACSQKIEALALTNDLSKTVLITDNAIADNNGRPRFTDKGLYDFTDAMLLSAVKTLSGSFDRRIRQLGMLEKEAKISFTSFFTKALATLMREFKAKRAEKTQLEERLEANKTALEKAKEEVLRLEQEWKHAEVTLIELMMAHATGAG